MSGPRRSGPLRLVLDTNVIVSAVLTPEGAPRRCLERALGPDLLVLTDATRAELLDVLHRPRLQRFLVTSERDGVLARLAARSVRVETSERVAACRDPKDDKFLDAAVAGRADYLVSGDEDLLVLHPFRDVPVLTPVAFLGAVEAPG